MAMLVLGRVPKIQRLEERQNAPTLKHPQGLNQPTNSTKFAEIIDTDR